MIRHLFLTVGLILGVSSSTWGADRASVEASLEKYLTSGDLQAAVNEFESQLATDPSDDHSRYALGMTRLFTAHERLTQDLFRYGFQVKDHSMIGFPLPIPENPNPEPITYLAARAMLQQTIDDLAVAAAILSEFKDPNVKLHVPFGLIRLDINGDGQVAPNETFWQIFKALNPQIGNLTEEQQLFSIGFDAGDVHWMIGYTHVLRAFAETWLAYDTEKFQEFVAPLMFSSVTPKFEISIPGGEQAVWDEDTQSDSFANIIASIHLASFELAEPERMPKVRQHLLEMVRQSRLSWDSIQKETDNDGEWIPNPNQSSVVGLPVTTTQVEMWKIVLDEMEAVLNGTKLLPHWRMRDGVGINLKEVLESPREFDIVLWAHGMAAFPYVQTGEVVSGQTTTALMGAFQGRFFLYAIRFN